MSYYQYMQKHRYSVKNIVFDFGGVLLNIDFNKTIQAFANLGMPNADQAYSKEIQAGFFQEFEKGMISENVFISEIQKLLKNASKDDVVNAWNALLIDFPIDRFYYLSKLKKKYKLFLLSNTNSIHEKAFMKIIDATLGWDNFNNLFDGIGYSHKMKMRKPDAEIFLELMKEYNLKPEETWFIDDTLMHVEAARKVGITALHLEEGKEIWDVLESLE